MKPVSTDRLIRMANQIATFFATQPGADQADRVAQHLRKFWEPRMLSRLLAHADTGGAGLHPLVQDAIRRLRETA